MARPTVDPETRYELHGKDSAGEDHFVGAARALLDAYRLRAERYSLNLKGYYVLDTLTGNKTSLSRIRDMSAWV